MLIIFCDVDITVQKSIGDVTQALTEVMNTLNAGQKPMDPTRTVEY